MNFNMPMLEPNQRWPESVIEVPVSCGQCKGVAHEKPPHNGIKYRPKPCPKCHGRGWVLVMTPYLERLHEHNPGRYRVRTIR